MNVNKDSWHYRTWRWFNANEWSQRPSVCAYLGFFVTLPFICLFTGLLYPVVAFNDWATNRCKDKAICPLGRVEPK